MAILEPGMVVRDTYEVERKLGEGAFAEVYRVQHKFLGRQAMKVFKAAGTTPEETERDLEEALLLSRIRHPNIVELFDANVVEVPTGRHGYFTMTYMPGGTLERRWRSYDHDLMPIAEVVDIAVQICRGLAVAHASDPPIVHRDIKPQNVLVRIEGKDQLSVRLSDFGLAKSVNPLTLLASARGTISFKPPEALDGLDSCAADIWSVGAMMYLLLTDQLPHPALSERDYHDPSRFLRPIRPPRVYNINVDPGLESIVFRCLAADPQDRYPDAGRLLSDLEEWEPGYAGSGSSVSASGISTKQDLTQGSPHDLKQEATDAIDRAHELARDPASLHAAADLLEEGLSKDPSLRDRYGYQLGLWRKGIMHVSTDDWKTRS